MATTYIGLYDKDATKTLVGNATTAWKWTLPTNINPRKSPTVKVVVAGGYLDDSYATIGTGNQNCSQPRMLRMKLFSENFLQNETSTTTIIYPIMSFMVRDAFVGHWYVPQAPHQVEVNLPVGISSIEFDLINEDGNVIQTLSTSTVGGKFNMVLKLIYPEHNELRNEVVMSYAQSQIGNPPFNRL